MKSKLEANRLIARLKDKRDTMDADHAKQIAAWLDEGTPESLEHAKRLESLNHDDERELGTDICLSSEILYDSAGSIIAAHCNTMPIAEIQSGLMKGTLDVDAEGKIITK